MDAVQRRDGGNVGNSRYISRVKAMLMATEVTDVHGNWVRLPRLLVSMSNTRAVKWKVITLLAR